MDPNMTHNKFKVLVVDDSKTALLDLRSKLSNLVLKENIFLAESYFDAVRLLMNHDFGIAFVDLQMPDKTGMDLIIDFIYKSPKTRDIPVVVTTSSPADSLVTHSLKDITFRYLFKPISLELLKEAMENIPPKRV